MKRDVFLPAKRGNAPDQEGSTNSPIFFFKEKLFL